LRGRRILLGVTGSVAAYKAAELVRALRKEGASVRVVMTEAATRFVTPLTFEVLSGQGVLTSLWEVEAPETAELAPAQEGATGRSSREPARGENRAAAGTRMPHLLSTEADTVLLAPATADILGKAACGIADDLLSSLLLAAGCPVVAAPAMNAGMYANPAVRENIAKLKSRGWTIVEPEEGELACGAEGRGRLASQEAILAAVREALRPGGPLRGRRVLVTAGRTEEPIDPVRYISNRSSGKMGFALAEAARRRGARVTLVAGAADVPPPPGVELVRVTTADEMAREVLSRTPEADVLIMAAAVADFKPADRSATKIKKSGGSAPTSIALEPTRDVLAEASELPGNRVTVGFSLELENEIENARRKLREKKLDLIVANNPSEPGCGFGSDTNRVTLVHPDGRTEELPLMTKREVAERVLGAVERILARGAGG